MLEKILNPFVSLYHAVSKPFQPKNKQNVYTKDVKNASDINVFKSEDINKKVEPSKDVRVDPFNSKKELTKIDPNEKVINKSGVRSAYSTPVAPKRETDPVKIEQRKQIEALKRQENYGILLQKIRQQESQRAAEQEKIRQEREKIAQERLAKEKLMEQKDAETLRKREAKMQERLKNGQSVSFSDGVKRWYEKATYNPKKELELEAKKEVLNEQFKDAKGEASRLDKPLLFNYLARNANGQLERSGIEALSRVDVYSFLVAEGYEVYEITAAKPNRINLKSFRFSKTRLVFYLSQLSAYIKSGIALADAVKILEDQTKKINEKRAWRAVYYDLSMGDVLSVALDKRGDTFPKLLINMIKTAEMTGNLTETLDDMVDYYSESEQTRKQMKSAMTYPVVVSAFAAIVVTFILMWVVPQFVGIYEDLGSDLPAITKIVIKISDFLKNYLLFIIIAVIIFCLVFIYLFRNVKDFKRKVQAFTMKLPIFGNIIIYNEVTIFAKTFANLINHNVFITDSMGILSKVTENEIYRKLIYETAKNLTKGDPISAAFKDQWAFPNIAYQMLITGEKTGRLGPMMERVANYYQEQHRNIINQMKSLIEPALIVSLAIIVGGILLSVIIPMYGMYDAL